jgi:hypothetical protein
VSSTPPEVDVEFADTVRAMLAAPSTEAARRIGDDFAARIEAADGGADVAGARRALDVAVAHADEPESVKRARGILAGIDPDRVKRVGYTAKESAAMRTIQAHDARQRADAAKPTKPARTSTPKSRSSAVSQPTTREQYSTPTFDADEVKKMGSAFAVFAAPGAGLFEPGVGLTYLGIFPGKNRQYDVAEVARKTLVDKHGWDQESADKACLISAKPNHFRTTPPLPDEQATAEPQEPAQGDEQPVQGDEQPAPAPTASTSTASLLGLDKALTEHKVNELQEAADRLGVAVTGSGKDGKIVKGDLVKALDQHAATLRSQQQPAAA